MYNNHSEIHVPVIMSNSRRACVSNDCDDGGPEKVFPTNRKEMQNKRRRELYAKRKELKGNKERHIGRPSQLQDSYLGDNVLCGAEALASCSIILGPESCADTTGTEVRESTGGTNHSTNILVLHLHIFCCSMRSCSNYVNHHISSREQITLQDTMEATGYSTSKFALDVWY